MANEDHLVILKRGVKAWNGWRRQNQGEPDLRGANLSGAELSGAYLSHADLSRTNLNCANLSDANLKGANLRSANLSGGNLRGANLSGANLNRADLNSANLNNADLNGVNLEHAILIGADLTRANLSGANLGHADLFRAILESTTFSGAVLSDAILFGADFSFATLIGANLENAAASFTKFVNCDLSEVKGLDLMKHVGPSTISIDTIYKSKGQISESFLRGCGVPEGFITQMRSLVGAEEDIQFYSCFISYSSKDEELARRLHGRMRDVHMRVWFAPEDIRGGKKLHEQIEAAIRVYDKLLIVLSEASLQSEWVMDELRKSFKAERDTGKRKLFPVRLIDYETLERWECRDSLSGKDLAEEVRQYFIPDFSDWKDHDSFEASFARLLNDLRAEERAK